MMSTELAFEDFLRSVSPLRVRLEFAPTPAAVMRARAYQSDTEALLAALLSGSRVRLEAAVHGLDMAA